MSDKKRKVITGKERKPDPRRQALESFREKTQKSVGDTQQDMIDENSVESESLSPLDSYVTTKNETLPNGDKKITATPPKVGNVIVDDQVTSSHDMKPKFKHEAINHEPDMTPDAPTAYDKRAEDMSRLLNDFKAARQREGIAAQRAGIQAGVHALNNPAAAQLYFQGSMNRAKSETDGITQGLENQYQYAKNEQQTISNAAQDDLDNPNSDVSIQGRKILLDQFGIKVPDTVNMRAINTVFPMVKTDTQRDTAVRGQDFKAASDEANRKLKAEEGDKNRKTRYAVADLVARHGFNKMVVKEIMDQQESSSKGPSAGEQTLANSATIPDAYTPSGFLVLKPGIPPNKTRADKVSELGGQAARYSIALKEYRDLMAMDNESRKTIFNEKWPAIKSAFEAAIQRNVKFKGNGVANGADIEHAINQVGSPSDLENFIRKGHLQKVDQALKGIRNEYDAFADSQGFTRSNKASPISQPPGGGPGGGNRRPLAPGKADTANKIAQEYNIPPVVGTPTPAPAPAQPGKKFIYRMINGVLTKVSQ